MKVTNLPPMTPVTTANTAETKPHVDEKIMKVAKQFESLFVNQLVGEMRKTVHGGGLVPQSQGEKIYTSMLDYEYSQKISDAGTLGLSRLIYDSLLRKSRGE